MRSTRRRQGLRLAIAELVCPIASSAGF